MRAQSSLNKLAGQSRGIILEAIQQQFSFMNETADELQTTTRRAVVAELGRRGGGAFPPNQQRVALCCGLIRLCIRTWNIPGGGGGGIERRSPEFNDVNLWILFFFLSPCSLCATVGGSFLYIYCGRRRQHPRAWMKRCSHASICQLTRQLSSHCSPTNRLVSRANPSISSIQKSQHFMTPFLFFFLFLFFFFFWRNKPIKILLIAPDDGRERSSLAWKCVTLFSFFLFDCGDDETVHSWINTREPRSFSSFCSSFVVSLVHSEKGALSAACSWYVFMIGIHKFERV